MGSRNHTKSIEDLSKRSISKKSEENYNFVKKKNATMNFVERRKNVSGKSPPNPFMSRLNITSFLDLMMSDKNEKSYTKNRKNPNNDSLSLFMNPTKSTRDNVQPINSTILSEQSQGLMNYNCESSIVDKVCPVCANELPGMLLYSYTSCCHYSCIDCWQCYVISRIENYEIGFGFTCLTCSCEITYQNILEIIKRTTDEEYSTKLIFRLENFYLERALLQDANFRRCPNRGCEFGVSLNPDYSGCPKLAKCQVRPTCSNQLCGGQCSIFWKVTAAHDCKYDPPTDIFALPLAIQTSNPALANEPKRSANSTNLLTRCFPWRRTKRHDDSKFPKLRPDKNRSDTDRSPSKVPMATHTDIDDIASMGSTKTTSSRTKFNYSTEPFQTEGEIKMCPKCHTYVLKMNDGSCNHMVCAVCGCEFCWLCMRQITDMHYLSPSGCTFWGRRQWNVEKRALWQMGTLIGAPLAIGFLAALAIPAMLIGIPLYVGRKIHGALKTKNKVRKRAIAVAGGVGAFIVSPVIAAVAVGLGVPLILAYVYVVMPIALCRASACSCDENNPPQEEVDFSDVENNPDRQMYDPDLGSSVKGDAEEYGPTHSRAEVAKPSDSPSDSMNNCNPPIPQKLLNITDLRTLISDKTGKKIKLYEVEFSESAHTSQISINNDPLSKSTNGNDSVHSVWWTDERISK